MIKREAFAIRSLARRIRHRIKGILKRILTVRPPPVEQPRNKHLWSIGIYTGSSPLELKPDTRYRNPVLTRDQVTDVPAGFVADPFLIRVGETWHMFFEVFNRRTWRGEIGLATSSDLATWQYQQIVLAEPFHISYPFVFEWTGEYYMVPETTRRQAIRLYQATGFPRQWKLIHTLMDGMRFADSTLFRHHDKWWLFAETSPDVKHDTLRLYFTDDLMGGWTEHPASPIVDGNPHTARPAGPIISTTDGLIRYAQDCSPTYGHSVRAFEITKLTTTEYDEHPVDGNPLLTPSGTGWNEAGMHHVSAHKLPSGEWIAGVDGWCFATAADIAGEA